MDEQKTLDHRWLVWISRAVVAAGALIVLLNSSRSSNSVPILVTLAANGARTAGGVLLPTANIFDRNPEQDYLRPTRWHKCRCAMSLLLIYGQKTSLRK